MLDLVAFLKGAHVAPSREGIKCMVLDDMRRVGAITFCCDCTGVCARSDRCDQNETGATCDPKPRWKSSRAWQERKTGVRGCEGKDASGMSLGRKTITGGGQCRHKRGAMGLPAHPKSNMLKDAAVCTLGRVGGGGGY